ncbi:MAG: hypothetical protein IKA64_01915 [Clostridia bacterium]|nr:hypothetical protein [Clostridia bacterium]
MKKRTKITNLLILITLLSLCFNLLAFAEEAPEGEGGAVDGTDTQTPAAEDLSGSETQASEPTWLETVTEVIKSALGEDFMAIVSAVFDVVILICLTLHKRTNTTSIAQLVKALVASGKDITELKKIQEAEKPALDEAKKYITEQMTLGFAAFEETVLERIEALGVSREQIAEIVELEKAQLEIFDTIYQHSCTVSQETKDRLCLLHNGALKKIELLESGGEVKNEATN